MTGSLCNNHQTVQHRDGLPPWCPNCGLTAGFRDPKLLKDEAAGKVYLPPPPFEPEPATPAEQRLHALERMLSESIQGNRKMTYGEIHRHVQDIIRIL